MDVNLHRDARPDERRYCNITQTTASSSHPIPLHTIQPTLRDHFPALDRRTPSGDARVVYLDGPAGSQVPQSVIDAVSH